MDVALQSTIILFLAIILSLACVAAETIFGIRHVSPRNMLVLVIGHYVLAQIALLLSIFIMGNQYAGRDDITLASVLYPAIAEFYYLVRTVKEVLFGSRESSEDAFTTRRFIAVGAIIVIINYSNCRLFGEFILVDGESEPLRYLIENAKNMVSAGSGA